MTSAPARPPVERAAGPTPLILERSAGERRVWRDPQALGHPGHFILKVDPKTAGSTHLVFGTETFAPGDTIQTHRHPRADEILYLENGKARVTLGESVREVEGGATVFIPANTWISVINTGTEAIRLLFIFSAPGFEGFMRAESVREGETVVPLSPAEDQAILARYANVVVYR